VTRTRRRRLRELRRKLEDIRAAKASRRFDRACWTAFVTLIAAGRRPPEPMSDRMRQAVAAADREIAIERGFAS
jgi:hypothetical protein